MILSKIYSYNWIKNKNNYQNCNVYWLYKKNYDKLFRYQNNNKKVFNFIYLDFNVTFYELLVKRIKKLKKK